MKFLSLLALFVQMQTHQNTHQARFLTPIYIEASHRYNIDPIMALAVTKVESRFRELANSGVGDIGLMQIRRLGCVPVSLSFLTDKQLSEPWVNIRLGVRCLAMARKRCGGTPLNWLSQYAGYPCGPSPYSRKVMEVYESVLTAAHERGIVEEW